MNRQGLETLYYYNKTCNLRCRHCWIEPDLNASGAGELTLPEVKDLISQCGELGMGSVKLLGGEPLLFPYFRELISFLIDARIKILIETNGTLIDDAIARQLGSANPFVSISLDGSNRKIHSILRGNPESFDKAVRGIQKLVENGIRPQVIFCLHAANRNDLDNIIRYARDLGAASIKINFITAVGRARDIPSERLSVADFIGIYKLHEKESYQDFKVQFDIPPAFHGIDCLVKGDNQGTCGIKGILGVLSNGDISICGIGNIRKDLVLGNVRTHRIEPIWNGNETLRTIRTNVPEGLGGICRRCIFKASCMGRCIANTYYETGSLFAGDRFCTEAHELGLFPQSRLL
ncbi:MAG: radical SAM protein [Syntrophobacter sp.]